MFCCAQSWRKEGRVQILQWKPNSAKKSHDNCHYNCFLQTGGYSEKGSGNFSLPKGWSPTSNIQVSKFRQRFFPCWHPHPHALMKKELITPLTPQMMTRLRAYMALFDDAEQSECSTSQTDNCRFFWVHGILALLLLPPSTGLLDHILLSIQLTNICPAHQFHSTARWREFDANIPKGTTDPGVDCFDQ